MPYRKRIADLDLKIENLRLAIEALRAGKMSRAELDRALSELARMRADRLRLMLRQVNWRAEQGLHEAGTGGQKDRAASAAEGNNPDG